MNEFAPCDFYNFNEKTHILTIDFGVLQQSHLGKCWTLKFRRLARNRLGQCNYTRKSIEINTDYLEINRLDQAQDTLKHEVAHAIVYEKYKSTDIWRSIRPHGRQWKEIAIDIGAAPRRCSKILLQKPKLNYWLNCPVHGVVDSWIKKPRWLGRLNKHRIKNLLCFKCNETGAVNSLTLNINDDKLNIK